MLKKNDVVVGNYYLKRVSGKLTTIKITEMITHEGYHNIYTGRTSRSKTYWKGVNIETNREIKILSASGLTPTAAPKPKQK